ncbi:MAG: hypothetical protein C4K58_00155 [Flavobacteriaceae bacterium]|nr:MAG: hypothetical protein C4K58_00155 [Flavobacteriaceae bacterium]
MRGKGFVFACLLVFAVGCTSTQKPVQNSKTNEPIQKTTPVVPTKPIEPTKPAISNSTSVPKVEVKPTITSTKVSSTVLAFQKTYTDFNNSPKNIYLKSSLDTNLVSLPGAKSYLYIGEKELWGTLTVFGMSGGQFYLDENKVKATENYNKTYIEEDLEKLNQKYLGSDAFTLLQIRRMLLGRILFDLEQFPTFVKADKKIEQIISTPKGVLVLKYSFDNNNHLTSTEATLGQKNIFQIGYKNWSTTPEGNPVPLEVAISLPQEKYFNIITQSTDTKPRESNFTIPKDYQKRNL